MNAWISARLTNPYFRLAIEELCREHPQLQDREAAEDLLELAAHMLPRMAANEDTAQDSPLQGLRRVYERWLDNRAHPERHYSDQIAELAEGRRRENPPDYRAEPAVRGRDADGIEVDLDLPEDHLSDRRSAIADLRSGRAGQPGGGRRMSDEQVARAREDELLRLRRRAMGA